MSARASRRAVLAGLATAPLAAAPALAAQPHPDAILLSLRPAFLAAVAEEGPLRTEYRRITDLAGERAGVEPKTNRWTAEWAAWDDRKDTEITSLGGGVAFRRWCEAENRLQAIIDRMAEIPATTLEGACFKAMAVAHDEVIGERVIADLLAMAGGA